VKRRAKAQERQPPVVWFRVVNPDGSYGELVSVTEGGTLDVRQPFGFEDEFRRVKGEGEVAVSLYVEWVEAR
jgi:hypothetical protein